MLEHSAGLPECVIWRISELRMLTLSLISAQHLLEEQPRCTRSLSTCFMHWERMGHMVKAEEGGGSTFTPGCSDPILCLYCPPQRSGSTVLMPVWYFKLVVVGLCSQELQSFCRFPQLQKLDFSGISMKVRCDLSNFPVIVLNLASNHSVI